MDYLYALLVLLVGYLIGSIQVPIMAGRILKKIDIREHGSGNAGSTNVARVLGFKVAVAVFILDILKGVIPYLTVKYFFGAELAIIIGVGAVLGHDFPLFMNFKGGKGVAITLGILTAYNPLAGIIALAVGILIIYITKYVSLASVSVAFTVLVFIWCQNTDTVELIGLTFLIVLLIYQHRGNIKRLLAGKENKFTLKKKS